MNNGDNAYMDVNGEMIPVVVVSTTKGITTTFHTVKLEADIQGCKTGEMIESAYSKVAPEATRRYGIQVDLFPRS